MSNSVVPVGVDQPNVLHALTRKHAEISGKIGQTRLILRQLTTELGHIDAAIRIFNPAIDIGAIKAKTIPLRDPAQRGEIARIVIDTLRDADEPVTPREITERLMEVRCQDAADRDLFNVMLKRVRACLRAQRVRGIVQATELTESTQGWEIA